MTSIAIASFSFARSSKLREALESRFPDVPKTWNVKHQVLSETELELFLYGHSHAIVGRELINEVLLSKLPGLRTIAKYGVGLDGIDLSALSKAGIRLGWTPGVNRTSVAELALTFMLTTVRRVHEAQRNLIASDWSRPRGFQLTGKTIGIIGCGNVGREVIRLLQPFECRILVNDIRSQDPEYQEFYQRHQLQESSLEELLNRSDLITVHTPRNRTTVNLINKRTLAMTRAGTILINTARGGIIDEADLLLALDGGQIAAAGLDVFSDEPSENQALLRHPKVICTPHVGGASEEAIHAMGLAAIEGLTQGVKPLTLQRYQ